MPRHDSTRPWRLIAGVAVAAGGWLLLSPMTWAQQPFNDQDIPPAVAGQQGLDAENVEPLARGPVHEAFLSPMEDTIQAAEVIPHQPPEPIDEVPPDVMPEGDPAWIPGYWMWSETENDFIWVSGVWREVPPGQRWVPGYWEQANGGWRWVAGFWTNVDTEGLTYLAPPPESLEQGPSSPAPSDDYFWVPGCWVDSGGDYVWRAGYWAQHQPGWIWVPNYYVWTPRGAVFCGGYWDHVVERRGLLFSPVLFRNRVYLQPGFRYAPSAVVVGSRLLMHLFVGPRWHHYYYGNYYGDVYTRVGLRPWFQDRTPLLNYYSWHFGRQDVHYVTRLQSWFRYQNQYPDYRPPIYYRQQLELAQRANDRTNMALLTLPLRDVARQRNFVRLDAQQRQQWENISGNLRTLARERITFEGERRGADFNRRDGVARGRLTLPQVSRVLRPIMGDDERGPGDRRDFDRRGPDGRPDFDRRPGPDGRPDFDGRRDLDRRDLDGRDRVGQPGPDGRPDFDRPGRDGRPGIDGRPDFNRPGTDGRRDLDGRPDFRDRRGDQPGVGQPGAPGTQTPDGQRPGTQRPDIRDRLQQPDIRDRLQRPDIQRGTQPDIRDRLQQPGTQRPDIQRGTQPDIRQRLQQPGTQPDIRQRMQRPEIQRGTQPDIRQRMQQPGVQRPEVQRGPQRPNIQAPSRRSTPTIQPPSRSGPPASSRPSFSPPGRSGTSTPSAAPRSSRPSFSPAPSSPGRSTPSFSPGRSGRSFSPAPSGGGRGPAQRGGGGGGRGRGGPNND